MASKKFDQREVKLNDGHVIHYSYYVRNLNIIQRLPYERHFTTDCQALPTSWLFKMVFQQVPDVGTVTCSITLKRTDGANTPMSASIILSLTRGNGGSPFISEKYNKKEMLPGEEMLESIAEVIPTEHMSTNFYEKIDIAIIVIVCNCHSMTPEKKDDS